MTTARTATIDTPDGPFTVVVGDVPPFPHAVAPERTDPRSAVLASGWTDDVASLVALVHPSLRPSSVEPTSVEALSVTTASTTPATTAPVPGRSASTEPASDDDTAHVLTSALAAVAAYYAGDHVAPATVAVHQRSGTFREHAWAVLRGVEPGEALTYTQYAERSGRPAAVRAAAGACAMNAAALFVPCHRVLRTDGSLGGFRYGLTIKQSLLDRERALDTMF